MDDRRPSIAVSPIIATLLLIAITVAAGVIVYVYVSGITGSLTNGGGGQQTGQQLELTAYSFTPITASTGCGGNGSLTGPCLTITIKDAGGSAVTIDTIYFNGLPLTQEITGGGATTPITLATHQDSTIQIAESGTFSGAGHQGFIGLPSASSTTGGSDYSLKIVTTTGGLFSYTVIAGSSQ